MTKLRGRAATANDKIQLALAFWWIVDAALQFQPAMFTSRFADEVIQNAGQGQPGFVAGPIHLASHIILWAPGPLNALFALVQLVIGVGLLFRRAVRPALVLSVLWSLNVWYLGEGLGGLAGGKAMLLTGAPGAVLLYAVLSVAAWPGRDRPRTWLIGAWVALWLGGCALQVIAGGGAVTDAISSNATADAPTWVRSADHALLSALPRPGAIVLILVALQAWIGLAVLGGPRFRMIPLGVGCLLGLAFWLFGESLGTYWTGVATDPNSGPLLVLMAGAMLATPAVAPSWRLGRLAPQRVFREGLPRQVAAALPTGLLIAAMVVVLAGNQPGSGARLVQAGPGPVQVEKAASVRRRPAARAAHRHRRHPGARGAHAAGAPRALLATARAGLQLGIRSATRAYGRARGRPVRESLPARSPQRPRPSETMSAAAQRPPAQGASRGPMHQLVQATQASASQAPPPAGPAAGQAVGAAASALPPG